MIRYVGAALIIAGGAAWGVAGVITLKRRAKNLQALVSALQAMNSEICDRLTPIPQLMSQLVQETTFPVSLLFKNVLTHVSDLGHAPFSAVWQRAILTTPELLLNSEEQAALQELGLCLGRYYVEEQRAAISYTVRRMEAFQQAAEADREKNARVRAFLGITAGVFAVIILL